MNKKLSMFAFINYTYLYKKGLTDNHLNVLIKVKQKNHGFIKNCDEIITLLKQDYLKLIKTGKTEIDRLRVTNKGNRFLLDVTTYEAEKDARELAVWAITAWERYAIPTGNHQRILFHINWFLKKTKNRFTIQQVHNGLKEWLRRGISIRMWLHNVFWNHREFHNNYTTVTNMHLHQSPLYGFMLKIEREKNKDEIL